MSNALVVIIFLVLLSVVLIAIGLGFRVLEAQRKKEVEGVLDIASGRPPMQEETSILVESKTNDPIENMIQRAASAQQLSEFIQQAGLTWTVRRLIASMLLCALAGAALGFIFRPLGLLTFSVIVAAALLGSVPAIYVRTKRAKRLHEFEQQLPEALDFLARSMRAGHAFSISLEMLGAETPDPAGQEFRTLFNELNLGAPMDTALASFSHRIPLLDIRLFVSSVLLQRQTGGNLSEILTRLSFIIRERFRLRGQVRAASAHGRITAVVLTCLPIAMVIALMIVAPGYLNVLANDSDGKWLIVGAIGAQVLGYFAMRSIVDIKV